MYSVNIRFISGIFSKRSVLFASDLLLVLTLFARVVKIVIIVVVKNIKNFILANSQ